MVSDWQLYLILLFSPASHSEEESRDEKGYADDYRKRRRVTAADVT
jgi:hypothetical protein